MSFIVYDLIFLALFVIFFSYLLHSGKKNLKKDGLLILYKTKWGIKLIDSIGKKYQKTLHFLSYISIAIGYMLMVGIVYLFGKIVYIYSTRQDIVQAIKIPPLLPLVPYIDKVAPNLGLPSFYFTYFIIVIAIIAITHEMAHGIFMRRYNVKIKSTGFAFFPWFLPIIPAAFVEQDEKSLSDSKKFDQLSILSAGVFANVLTAIFFFAIMFLFFSTAFTQGGVVFDNYPYSPVALSAISTINGVPLDNPSHEKLLELSNEKGFNQIKTENQSYIILKEDLERYEKESQTLFLFYDAPAIKEKLEKTILEVNGVKITSVEVLKEELSKYSPSEKITLNVLGKDGGDYDRDIVLGENPLNKNLSWLGIGFIDQSPRGVLGKMASALSFKEPQIYYESKIGDFGLFVYDLLWWIILISISVALVNMLPVGIFDGGRFFYLTIWGLTKNEKIAKNAFAFMTYFILGLFLLLMLLWGFAFL
jgi:hypothetical protein|tara:strand:- start:2193 stop:3620 length:1428 start_codon:yes stop_codon:yes gene_type:complete